MVISRNVWRFLSMVLGLAVFSPAVARGEVIEDITRPSADVMLPFVRGGRVAEVLVKEGDVVQAGQLLIRQDDQAERLQLEQLKAEAEDTTRVEAAEAQLAQKREDLKKLEWARKEGAATDWEVEHARLDVRIAELSLRLARFEREQNRRKYAEAKVLVERLRLVSPIAGRVEQVAVEPGEAAEPMVPVLRVVRIDPLWIEVPVSLARARRLRCGQAARVAFLAPSGVESQGEVRGKIIHIAAVADGGSETLTVRVEVPNPAGRPAGEHVHVAFPASAETAPSEKKVREVQRP